MQKVELHLSKNEKQIVLIHVNLMYHERFK